MFAVNISNCITMNTLEKILLTNKSEFLSQYKVGCHTLIDELYTVFKLTQISPLSFWSCFGAAVFDIYLIKFASLILLFPCLLLF